MKKTAKKNVNSCKKGKRTENELVKILNDCFGDGEFARIPTSGALSRKVKNLSAKISYTGDMITPKGFKFSIESKSANIDVDFFEMSVLFDRWLQQATDDAARVSRMPMLCWKQHRKGWIVALPARAFNEVGHYGSYYVRYANNTPQWRWGWIILRLDALLESNDGNRKFWFNDEENYD